MAKDVKLPSGVTKVESPKYPEGSFVAPNVDHMPGLKGKKTKVLAVVTGTFYVLEIDGKPHYWYQEDEVKKYDPKNDPKEKGKQKAADRSTKKSSMGGMKM
ncbi:hypothetical protein BKM15_25920 [Pseudomonas syringae pv. syringae]|nr:hypothetical protein BKM15_25920 [Pseudomonas syringae pv. syringae]